MSLCVTRSRFSEHVRLIRAIEMFFIHICMLAVSPCYSFIHCIALHQFSYWIAYTIYYICIYTHVCCVVLSLTRVGGFMVCGAERTFCTNVPIPNLPELARSPFCVMATAHVSAHYKVCFLGWRMRKCVWPHHTTTPHYRDKFDFAANFAREKILCNRVFYSCKSLMRHRSTVMEGVLCAYRHTYVML